VKCRTDLLDATVIDKEMVDKAKQGVETASKDEEDNIPR
jgi:hypothetical protein